MKSKFYSLKSKVIKFRKAGKTYGEIIKLAGKNIPKSTLSDWCSKIYLNSKQRKIIDKKIKDNCKKGMEVAWIINKKRRKNLDRGSLRFGNSDSFIIGLFLNLMRKYYKVDEKKFRCTILCRADQNVVDLEKFWQEITKIPKSQFYKARIDARTIGKPSQKINYRGVCAIDYFSADTFLDLMQIPKTVFKMGL